MVGLKGKRERKKRTGMEPVQEKKFPHSGNPLHWLGNQLGQRRCCRGSEKRAAEACRRQVELVLATSLAPSLRHASAGAPGGGQILERTALSVQRGWSVVWVATASVHWMKPGLPQKPHSKSKSEGRGSLGFGMLTAGVALTRLAWGTHKCQQAAHTQRQG